MLSKTTECYLSFLKLISLLLNLLTHVILLNLNYDSLVYYTIDTYLIYLLKFLIACWTHFSGDFSPNLYSFLQFNILIN